MKRLLLGSFVLLFFCRMGQADWLKEVELSHDPEKDGQADYTVRILPAQTHLCDQIILECVYRQKFPWENARGKKYIKIHEPVSFTYRRHHVRLVADLDAYISFRVPISPERLSSAYGPTVFRKGVPITVSRIKISGLLKGKPLWSHDLEADQKHDLTDKKEEK